MIYRVPQFYCAVNIYCNYGTFTSKLRNPILLYLLTSAVAAPEVRDVAVVEPGQGLLRVLLLVTKVSTLD